MSTLQQFEHRGIVEGFYGRPWSHADRLWMIERLGTWGMNRYVYAPKDDPLHRSEWRTPYSDGALREFEEMVECGARAAVEVGFALSPGLSISYASADDRRALNEKFKSFQKLGTRFFSLALDDVPRRLVHEADRRSFESLGHAHLALVSDVCDSLGPDALLWLVPTDYLGVESTDYLELLGAELAPSVEVAWTGRTVVSPTIEFAEAAARAATLRRRLLLWDNLPVSDGPMRSMLHLGPYAGRAPELEEHVSGILLNPMEHARASAVAIHTAAEYLADPRSYDPEAAWRAALEELGEGDAEALRAFAFAHRFSPQCPDDRDPELQSGFARLVELLEGGADLEPALEELRARVEVRLEAADRIRRRLRDRSLAAELEPWLKSHQRETRRMAAALDTARVLLGDGARSEKVFAFMGMEARFAREPETGKTSYGPRRVLYPQLSSMREDDMSLAETSALVRDRNLADELVEFVEDLALFLLSHPNSLDA